jgi:hypothetical protein
VPKVVAFSRVYYKIHILKFRRAYIFRNLQHFATKLWNCTNFNMLFLAVVMDFGPDQSLMFIYKYIKLKSVL